MGLLDMIVPSSDGGGLLDFLKRNAALQSFPSGPAFDQAQYGSDPNAGSAPLASAPSLMGGISPAMAPPAQASPLDAARWPYGPVGAPSAANTQMPPQQPPAVIPAQAPQTAAAPPAGAGGPLSGANPFSGLLNRGADALASIAHGGSLLGAVRGQFDDPKTQQAQAQNVTARALLAKGIDPAVVAAAVQPGNSEMLKTLITQTMGPPKAPVSLGNGWVWNPQTNKYERAYEPDDKTPVGFEKTDKGLKPIAGGPADPAYLRAKAAGETDPTALKVAGKGAEIWHRGPNGEVIIDHKNEEGAPEATLDDATTKAMAAQYLAGDRTVMQNLGRGAQGAANIVKIRTEIYKQANSAGLDGKGIVDNFNEQAGALAGERAVGTRAANISLAANEANNMIDVAVKASKAVPRSQYVPLNKAIQAIQTGSSSPELASFVAATNSLVNAYVRAVSPSGVPTDSMREHAYSMLNSAQSHEAYMSVIETMKKEMDAALKAPGQVRKELRRSGDKPEGGSATSPLKVDGYTITEH